MLGSADIRIERMEKEIESLRRTQTLLLKLVNNMTEPTAESTNGFAERLPRLQDDNGQEVAILPIPEIKAKLSKRRDLILECHAILLAIADHLELAYEKPSGDT